MINDTNPGNVRITTQGIFAQWAKSRNLALSSATAAVVPDLDSLTRAAEHCTRERIAATERLNQARDAAEPVIRTTVNRLLAGELLTGEEMVAEVTSRDQMVNAAEDQVQKFERFEHLIGEHIVTAISGKADAILWELNKQLQQLVGDIRQLPLNHLGSADDAIANDRTDEWKQYAELRSRSLWIRDAQQQVMKQFGMQAPNPEEWAEIENLGELWPGWLDDTLAPQSREGWTISERVCPWSDNPGDRFDQLVRTPNAKLWVPTPRQLAAARAAATEQARARAESRGERPAPEQSKADTERLLHNAQVTAALADTAWR